MWFYICNNTAFHLLQQHKKRHAHSRIRKQRFLHVSLARWNIMIFLRAYLAARLIGLLMQACFAWHWKNVVTLHEKNEWADRFVDVLRCFPLHCSLSNDHDLFLSSFCLRCCCYYCWVELVVVVSCCVWHVPESTENSVSDTACHQNLHHEPTNKNTQIMWKKTEIKECSTLCYVNAVAVIVVVLWMLRTTQGLWHFTQFSAIVVL